MQVTGAQDSHSKPFRTNYPGDVLRGFDPYGERAPSAEATRGLAGASERIESLTA